jgi:hypothetical protein
MGQYKPMFNISMEHTYFSDGKLTGVELVPTAESAKIMSNANLVLRKRQDGVTVFFDNDYIDALRLYAEDETDPLRLNFECEIDNSNFQNFTAASAFAANKTLFFDSKATDGAIFGKKYLHLDDHVSEIDLAENFTNQRALNASHDSVLYFSQSRALLFNNEQTALNPSGKEKLNPEDAQQRANLGQNAASASGSPSSRRQPSLGLVSISVTPQELTQLSESSALAYNDYHIRFKARETHWKYVLVGDANREGAFIKDVNGEMEFDYLGEEMLADGRLGKVFLSQQAIALKDRAKAKFQLLVPKNNRIKVLVNRLAVASAKRINKVKVADKELFVSEIYINF